MGRRSRPPLLPWVKGGPAICDACGERCGTLDQCGIPCWFCKAGVFIPAEAWDFWPCPANCYMRDPFCIGCGGRAFVAVPREDLPIARLIAIWRELPSRYSRQKEPVPTLIDELARLAEAFR